MKTSYILLATVALVTLTGMVATDVLLKQQYEKIDWKNPYQNFEKRTLSTASHWVIEGAPTDEIQLIKTGDKPQALIHPEYVKFYRVRQQGDTAYVAFTPDYNNYHNEPIEDADHELPVRLVLRVPQVKTIRTKNARLTVADLATNQIQIQLENSRLLTRKLAVQGTLDLRESHNSFALFGSDQLALLQLTIQDSSGVELDNAQLGDLSVNASSKAKVYFQGKALKWIKSK